MRQLPLRDFYHGMPSRALAIYRSPEGRTAGLRSRYACRHTGILFERMLWERMGGFTRAREGELGREEVDPCAFCCAENLAMLCAHRVFAGSRSLLPESLLGKILILLSRSGVRFQKVPGLTA